MKHLRIANVVFIGLFLLIIWGVSPWGFDLFKLSRNVATCGNVTGTSPTLAKLCELEVKPLDESQPYNRDEFGERWADVDGNGCDTRNDVLGRDLDRVEFKRYSPGCVVHSGILHDPYTGTKINFIKGDKTSELVQIDHVVALGNAWRTGANAWSLAQRERFANDPNNLLAVEGQANQDKGRSPADEWLPPNPKFRCTYVTKQIEVKWDWGLWVTPAEKAAMLEVLGTCPGGN